MTAYASVLGARLADCLPEVQALHSRQGDFDGEITVWRPKNPLLALAGRLAGFPAAGTSPITLRKRSNGPGDTWTRAIGDFTMTSHQRAQDHCLSERIGPVSVRTALDVQNGEISMRVTGWRLLGLPMPRALAPHIDTREAGRDGRYHFRVEIGLPLIKTRLVRYEGHLQV